MTQEKQLLVTADDAFMHPDNDAAILFLLTQDFCPLTNVSFAVDGEYANTVAKYKVAAREDVDFGLHIVLPPGNFDQKRGMLPLLRWSNREITNKVTRQYTLFCKLFGYPPGHVNSHFGVHQVLPQVLFPVVQLAREWHIPVRSFSGVAANIQFSGRRHLGTTPESIINAFQKIRPGRPEEIIFHPAWNPDGKQNSRIVNGYDEFRALCNPRLQAFFENDPHIRRMSWKDFHSMKF